VAEYGADSLRLYEMFMGPLEAGIAWDTQSISGVHRFLKRVWALVAGEESAMEPCRPTLVSGSPVPADPGVERALHRCIRDVTRDLEGLRFNTAIAAMMSFLNEAGPTGLSRSQAMALVKLVAPLAPHLAEELWKRLGHETSLAYEPWPAFDPSLCMDSVLEVVVQVNGKLRTRLNVPAGTGGDSLKELALQEAKVREALKGGVPKKVIVVPDKLVNVVV
jgi:leucyl-tRNA synthetase